MGSQAGYFVLRDDVGATEVARDVVRVSGPDAQTYLQGQTSQDIAALGPGGWAWALVLQPQGKLDVFVRVYRVGPDEFLLDSDAGMGASLVARLSRFKLRTKVDIEQLPWRVLAVRGPRAEAGRLTLPPDGDPAAVVPFEWGGLVGYDLFGPNPAWPADVAHVEPADYEALRVEAGFPVHGRELDERTIPAEAGLVAAAVSFTKGCYTGQELVARIDSRGSNVPRHLRGLVLSGPAQAGAGLHVPQPGLAPGAEAGNVEQADQREAERGEEPAAGEARPNIGNPEARRPEGGPARSRASGPKEVGRVTSVAFSPRLGWVALGYVSRGVELGSTLEGRDEEGGFEARVELLPLT